MNSMPETMSEIFCKRTAKLLRRQRKNFCFKADYRYILPGPNQKHLLSAGLADESLLFLSNLRSEIVTRSDCLA